MMNWILRIAASLLASLGILALVVMAYPKMHWSVWHITWAVLTMSYIIWTASLIVTGLYWAYGNKELRHSHVPTPSNVIIWPGSKHLSKGPKAS